MNGIYLDYYAGIWVNTSLYQIIQTGTGDGITFSRPTVSYNGDIYRYIDRPTPSNTPGQYVTPDTDPNAVALSFNTYAQFGVSSGTIANGLIPFTTGISSTNISLAGGIIQLPLNLRETKFSMVVKITSAASSSATLTLTAINGARLDGSTTTSIIPAVNRHQTFFGLVASGATIAPQISLIASSVTGTITIDVDSDMIIGG